MTMKSSLETPHWNFLYVFLYSRLSWEAQVTMGITVFEALLWEYSNLELRF